MEISKLFSDALTYPSKDYNKVLILGVFFIIMTIFSYIPSILSGMTNFIVRTPFFNNITILIILSIFFGLLSLIISFFVNGYQLNIIKKTISLENNVPDFNWGKNFVGGLKRFALEIVYYAIPIIVTIIMFVLVYLLAYGSKEPLITFISSIFGIIIVAILFIISALLLTIAIAILAETDSLIAAINVKNVIIKISEIGWTNYILWIIVLISIFLIIGIILFITLFVISFISGLMTTITGNPLIGTIILLLTSLILGLTVSPYLTMFYGRALGLLYNESKNN